MTLAPVLDLEALRMYAAHTRDAQQAALYRHSYVAPGTTTWTHSGPARLEPTLRCVHQLVQARRLHAPIHLHPLSPNVRWPEVLQAGRLVVVVLAPPPELVLEGGTVALEVITPIHRHAGVARLRTLGEGGPLIDTLEPRDEDLVGVLHRWFAALEDAQRLGLHLQIVSPVRQALEDING